MAWAGRFVRTVPLRELADTCQGERETMLHYYYEYRNDGDEDIQVVEDLGETHPVPQTAESMQRLQYMRDDAREHARYRPTAFPVTILPWIEPDWQDNHRLVAVAQGGTFAAGLCSCGKVFMDGWIHHVDSYLYRNVANWSDIVAISADSRGIVGLRRNGQAVAAGFNGYREGVERWRHIVQVSASDGYIAGLRRDGRVVCCSGSGSWTLDGWTDVVQVSAGKDYLLGVRRDGTVLCDENWGYSGPGEDFGTGALRDIVQVSAGLYHAVGLRRDGTVVALERPDYYEYQDDVNCLDVMDWRDIVQVCAGVGVTAGLSRDGWVLVAWNETDATYGFGMGAATAISVCRSEDRDNYGYIEYGRERHEQAVLWLDAHGHATSTSHGDFDWLRWDG